MESKEEKANKGIKLTAAGNIKALSFFEKSFNLPFFDYTS